MEEKKKDWDNSMSEGFLGVVSMAL